MRTKLKPYPAMKDSGVEWLGEFPEHWNVQKLRTVLRNVADRNRPDLPLLSVVREKGVIVRDVSNQDENHNYIPDDLTNYKVVRDGQFAMNKMKAWQGSYGVSSHDGIVSPAYFVFDINGVTGDFFDSAIRSKAYVPFFTQASDGVRIGQWDLSQARMREIIFLLPPHPEQAAIVRYLDHVDRRMRRLVRAKRKLIALLTEQKQAIIHHAVTRGLDPDVPLKDSGVEWLGEVPEHWEVAAIKRLLAHMDYGTSEAAKADGSILLLTMANIQQGEVISAGSGGLYEVPNGLLLEHHDLLFTRTNGNPRLVGKIGIFRGSAADEVTFASYLVRLRVLPNTDPVWLHLLLNSPVFWGFARSHALVNLQTNLNSTRYGQFKIPVPSPLEQRQIVEWVERETHQLADAAASASREIDLLTEYSIRLIADVVTGKLDVREAAAALPEVDPMGTEGDLDDMIDTDIEADIDELDVIPEEVEA